MMDPSPSPLDGAPSRRRPIDPFVIELEEPADDFTRAFLLGNGRLGVTVSGRPGTEDLDLNLDTLWSGGPLPPDDGRVGDVTELREAIARGDVARADELARRVQSDRWSQSYLPLGRLRFTWGAAEATDGYRRALHLRDAEAVTRVGRETLTSFVSAVDDVLVAWVDGDGAVDGDGVIESHGAIEFITEHLGATIERVERAEATLLIATGRAPALVLPDYLDDPDPVRYGRDEPDADGTVAAGMGWALVAAVSTDPDGTRRLTAAARTGFRGFRARPSADLHALARDAEATVIAALGSPIPVLRERHRRDVNALVDRTRIDLSASNEPSALEAARYFNLGRALLIASSRPGSQAAALQGIWNVDMRPAWSGNYTTNINTQMNYWGAEPTGLADLHEPLFDLIDDLVETGAVVARQRYGAAGSAVHHNGDLWRFADPVRGEPQWANWATALPWLAAHLAQHAAFGAPAAFAVERELPVLRAAVDFLESCLVDDGTGALVVSPSTGPENLFLSDDGEPFAVTWGSTMDQEFALESIARAIVVGRQAGEPPERIEHLERLLERVRRPRIEPRGVLEEWAGGRTPNEQGHRHLSHLYGVYPGGRITARATPAEFAAARAALDERLAHGSGYTGWSGAWILALAARFGDRALASHAIDRLVHALSSSSLLDLHPHERWDAGVVFQIDGNLGAPGAMAELLVQSHDGAVSLLPTLPREWRAGTAAGLRARGGITIDLRWSGGVLEEAVLVCSQGGPVVIELDAAPGPHAEPTPDAAVPSASIHGAPVAVRPGPATVAGRRRWVVETTPGVPTHIRP